MMQNSSSAYNRLCERWNVGLLVLPEESKAAKRLFSLLEPLDALAKENHTLRQSLAEDSEKRRDIVYHERYSQTWSEWMKSSESADKKRREKAHKELFEKSNQLRHDGGIYYTKAFTLLHSESFRKDLNNEKEILQNKAKQKEADRKKEEDNKSANHAAVIEALDREIRQIRNDIKLLENFLKDTEEENLKAKSAMANGIRSFTREKIHEGIDPNALQTVEESLQTQKKYAEKKKEIEDRKIFKRKYKSLSSEELEAEYELNDDGSLTSHIPLYCILKDKWQLSSLLWMQDGLEWFFGRDVLPGWLRPRGKRWGAEQIQNRAIRDYTTYEEQKLDAYDVSIYTKTELQNNPETQHLAARDILSYQEFYRIYTASMITYTYQQAQNELKSPASAKVKTQFPDFELALKKFREEHSPDKTPRWILEEIDRMQKAQNNIHVTEASLTSRAIDNLVNASSSKTMSYIKTAIIEVQSLADATRDNMIDALHQVFTNFSSFRALTHDLSLLIKTQEEAQQAFRFLHAEMRTLEERYEAQKLLLRPESAEVSMLDYELQLAKEKISEAHEIFAHFSEAIEKTSKIFNKNQQAIIKDILLGDAYADSLSEFILTHNKKSLAECLYDAGYRVQRLSNDINTKKDHLLSIEKELKTEKNVKEKLDLLIVLDPEIADNFMQAEYQALTDAKDSKTQMSMLTYLKESLRSLSIKSNDALAFIAQTIANDPVTKHKILADSGQACDQAADALIEALSKDPENSNIVNAFLIQESLNCLIKDVDFLRYIQEVHLGAQEILQKDPTDTKNAVINALQDTSFRSNQLLENPACIASLKNALSLAFKHDPVLFDEIKDAGIRKDILITALSDNDGKAIDDLNDLQRKMIWQGIFADTEKYGLTSTINEYLNLHSPSGYFLYFGLHSYSQIIRFDKDVLSDLAAILHQADPSKTLDDHVRDLSSSLYDGLQKVFLLQPALCIQALHKVYAKCKYIHIDEKNPFAPFILRELKQNRKRAEKIASFCGDPKPQFNKLTWQNIQDAYQNHPKETQDEIDNVMAYLNPARMMKAIDERLHHDKRSFNNMNKHVEAGMQSIHAAKNDFEKSAAASRKNLNVLLERSRKAAVKASPLQIFAVKWIKKALTDLNKKKEAAEIKKIRAAMMLASPKKLAELFHANPDLLNALEEKLVAITKLSADKVRSTYLKDCETTAKVLADFYLQDAKSLLDFLASKDALVTEENAAAAIRENPVVAYHRVRETIPSTASTDVVTQTLQSSYKAIAKSTIDLLSKSEDDLINAMNADPAKCDPLLLIDDSPAIYAVKEKFALKYSPSALAAYKKRERFRQETLKKFQKKHPKDKARVNHAMQLIETLAFSKNNIDNYRKQENYDHDIANDADRLWGEEEALRTEVYAYDRSPESSDDPNYLSALQEAREEIGLAVEENVNDEALLALVVNQEGEAYIDPDTYEFCIDYKNGNILRMDQETARNGLEDIFNSERDRLEEMLRHNQHLVSLSNYALDFDENDMPLATYDKTSHRGSHYYDMKQLESMQTQLNSAQKTLTTFLDKKKYYDYLSDHHHPIGQLFITDDKAIKAAKDALTAAESNLKTAQKAFDEAKKNIDKKSWLDPYKVAYEFSAKTKNSPVYNAVTAMTTKGYTRDKKNIWIFLTEHKDGRLLLANAIRENPAIRSAFANFLLNSSKFLNLSMQVAFPLLKDKAQADLESTLASIDAKALSDFIFEKRVQILEMSDSQDVCMALAREPSFVSQLSIVKSYLQNTSVFKEVQLYQDAFLAEKEKLIQEPAFKEIKDARSNVYQKVSVEEKKRIKEVVKSELETHKFVTEAKEALSIASSEEAKRCREDKAEALVLTIDDKDVANSPLVVKARNDWEKLKRAWSTKVRSEINKETVYTEKNRDNDVDIISAKKAYEQAIYDEKLKIATKKVSEDRDYNLYDETAVAKIATLTEKLDEAYVIAEDAIRRREEKKTELKLKPEELDKDPVVQKAIQTTKLEEKIYQSPKVKAAYQRVLENQPEIKKKKEDLEEAKKEYAKAKAEGDKASSDLPKQFKKYRHDLEVQQKIMKKYAEEDLPEKIEARKAYLQRKNEVKHFYDPKLRV